MKGIILVAGYATRLYPLTLTTPKPLLLISGRPMIDYIVDELNTISEVNEILVISNHKFADQFHLWAKTVKSNAPVKVIDDGTDTVETRLGAIGDIQFTITQEKIDEDVMIVAGDNLFTFKLKDYYAVYKKLDKDFIVVKEINDEEEIKAFAVAVLDGNGKVLDLEEKPKNPKSNTAAFATYIYKRETIPLFAKYLEEGNVPDAPGYFVSWLYKKKDVYAYKMQGECYDVGTKKALEEVQKIFG